MALSVLTPTQQCAMDYVREQSKSEASDRYPELCMRIIKLGYTPKDLQRYCIITLQSASSPFNNTC